jgi:hypothetical protein
MDEHEFNNLDSYVTDAVTIEPLALEEEFVRMPADLAYWNNQYANALRTYQLAKRAVEQLNALLTIEHRERLNRVVNRVTEAMIDSAVQIDERMDEAKEALIHAEVDKVRIAGVCEAVRTKRDMLISIGAHVRAEMARDPVIRTQHADAREHRYKGA